MIPKTLRSLLAVVLVLSIVSFALARGAPPGKTFVDQATVIQAAPVITSAPPMSTSYDVICNLTISRQSISVDTSTWLRLRNPVDWQSGHQTTRHTSNRPAPELVLLA